MRPVRWIHPIAAIVLLVSGLLTRAASADDAAAAFSKTNNPTGPWLYGYTFVRGTPLAVFAAHGTDSNGLDYWTAGAGQARVSHNGTGTGKLVGGTVYTPDGGLNLTPGNDDSWAVVRWTAPQTGTYEIDAHFVQRTLANAFGGGGEVALLHSGAVVFDRWLPLASGMTNGAVSVTLPINAGETIDFAAGPAAGVGPIGLDATIDLVTPPATSAGPVFTFGGQRFAACRWGKAFESIAYDPLNHRLASNGFLQDRCGNTISAGPDQEPGLAWDSATSTYWQITNDRVVRRWSAAGALLDTVFTIPLTFSVPGTGADTLESARGIATDSSFVYVVDAGPLPGALASGEWLKFTRTGAPVKSSKSTNFNANLGPGNDATVDDICYVPFGSPIFPGRLIVALEHTGLQVIDTNGNFVGTFRWATQGFATRPISALSGVAVDPASGNLYLADNGTGAAMVLTRITTQGTTSYIVGTLGSTGGQNTGVLKYPNPGCDLPLWNTLSTGATGTANEFGLAYRSADNSVVGVDFTTGTLNRFDPLMGTTLRVGESGVQSSWGIAYDTERDVLYAATAYSSGVNYIVTIDPVGGSVATLPSPIGATISSSSAIAWDPVDKKIYAVDGSTTPIHLIRIDRDTGAGTVAANVTGVRGGLTFEAGSGKLVGVASGGLSLLTIDPATGATSTLTTLAAGNGFEGLAAIPVPANVVSVAMPDAPAEVRAGLEIYPNPSRGSAVLAFELPTPQRVSVGVYDVLGRRVRGLATPAVMLGTQRMNWDGHDDDGQPVASGIYFARVESGGQTRVARIVIAR